MYYCTAKNDGQCQCWDGVEWEWENKHENDGTADNSWLTSILTDGFIATSVSIDVRDAVYTVSLETSLDENSSESLHENVQERKHGRSGMIDCKKYQC